VMVTLGMLEEQWRFFLVSAIICKFYVICLGCRAVGSACILNVHK
jgi:hypothetical protein